MNSLIMLSYYNFICIPVNNLTGENFIGISFSARNCNNIISMNTINRLLLTFTIILSVSTFAVCTDQDVSGCKIDMNKCIELAERSPIQDHVNMFRFQCIKTYHNKISKKDCLEQAQRMEIPEEVQRAESFCNK